MKTILVPTDFSENANNTIKYAAALANSIQAKLILVNIINLPATPLENGIVLPMISEMFDNYNAEIRKIADGIEIKYNNQFQIETICQYGYFLTNLNQLVKNKKVDLVIMGTKGASNLLDKYIGTNTSEFIKMAVCPVLAIPAQATFTGISHIAYASDFECEETIYLQQLIQVAELLTAQLSIVNIKTDYQLNIVADCQVLKDIIKNFPYQNVSISQIRKNDVIKGLYEFVQDNKADVLAVSIQKRGLIENLFHSSISNKLFCQSKLPLLSLPSQPYQKSVLNNTLSEISY